MMMDTPDEIIHQTTRLRIMATLNSLPADEPMEFTRLRGILSATDGNLGTHLGTLESNGYIQVQKDFAGRKPRTRIFLTAMGRKAFARHVAYLRGLLDVEGA
jgi:DNA-binding MarR family transcriptional regulator